MLIVRKRIAPQPAFDAELALPFEQRQKSRLRTTVAGGEEIGLFLERGSILRGGEFLRADDGRVVRVDAAAEDLLEVQCAQPEALARAAYHLGNRHTPVQVGGDWLRIAEDSVLAEMLRGMGATVTAVRAPFEPEAGAYAAGWHSHSSEAKHAGIIHDFAPPRPAVRAMPAAPSSPDAITGSDTGGTRLLPLVRLLQLASPALPIGAYSYSQGLEWAVEASVVRDAASAQAWIGDMLSLVVARGEVPIAFRLLHAAGGDWPALTHWNAWFRATRETAELRAETLQMGQSLIRLAGDLQLLDAAAHAILPALDPVTLPAAFALAARGFEVPVAAALAAYIWSWLENQVLAAVKLVPLGQVAGQRLLAALGGTIPAAVATAAGMRDDDIATFAPGLALASSRHERQYTRLFRS